MVDMSATIIHHGHIRLLQKASIYGDVIVGLTTDDEVLAKKGYLPEIAFEYRKEILESIKYVHEVVAVPWALDDAVLEKYSIDLLVHGDDNSNNIKKEKLGPATTTESVKMAQVVPDICPREQEFGDMMEHVSNELTTIVADTKNYTTILFAGSGTAVVESVISSVVPRQNKILIINNGAYGKRMCQIASSYNIDFVEFVSSSIEPIDLDKLQQVITQDKTISHIAVVHNETTTGLLNNLDNLSVLTKKHNIKLIVDAMSSYAAIPIDMQKQNISYLMASSNKNIQAMAGIGFVIANKKHIEQTKDIKPRNFYLNLYAQYENFIKTKQMRFTPPVQTMYALKQAIYEAKEEGIANRYQRYCNSWEVLISFLKQNNMSYLVDDKYHSKIITSVLIPKNIDFNHMHDYFYENKITIYPGKVSKFNTFRVANIGQIDYKDMQRFTKLLKGYIDGKV